MKITKLNHACVLLEHEGNRVVVDPGSHTTADSVGRLAGLVDAVLVTHRHGDHYDPGILKAIGAPLFGVPEVVHLAADAGLTAHALAIGTPAMVAGMNVTTVPANHGPNVTQPVENVGFIVEAGGVSIYITGDMKGTQDAASDIAVSAVVVPFEGGRFVFSPAEAAAFVSGLRHKGLVIPVHADGAADNAREFVEAARSEAWTSCVMAVGEQVEVSR